MAIYLETLTQSEHFKLKGTYNRVFTYGFIAAVIAHVLAAVFSPPYAPTPYQLREKQVQVIELPDAIVIPPPPADIVRPELPQEIDISDTGGDDTDMIATTDFNPFAPPAIPDASQLQGDAQAEVFVAYDTAPEPVHTEAPIYPDLARQAEAEGSVMVLVTIDETGRVVNAVVQESDAIQSLQEAAVAAAYKWLFKPAKQRDQAVKVRIVIPFRFSLD